MRRFQLRGSASTRRPGPPYCGYSLAVRTGASQALNPGSNPGGRIPFAPTAFAPRENGNYLGGCPPGFRVARTSPGRRALALAVAVLVAVNLPVPSAFGAPA